MAASRTPLLPQRQPGTWHKGSPLRSMLLTGCLLSLLLVSVYLVFSKTSRASVRLGMPGGCLTPDCSDLVTTSLQNKIGRLSDEVKSLDTDTGRWSRAMRRGWMQQHEDFNAIRTASSNMDDLSSAIKIFLSKPGPVGPRGPVGFVGARGMPGLMGARGGMGHMGPEGLQGPEGREGRRGQPGMSGEIGPAGQQGPPGRWDGRGVGEVDD